MRQETTTRTLYTFDELSDEAKEQARDWYQEGALDYDWWDCTYEDAATIGLKIEGFDLDRNRHVDGRLTVSGTDSCRLIMKEHGESCDTYKLAVGFLPQFEALDKKLEDMQANEENEDKENEWDIEDDIDELEKDYTYQLREEYASMLQNECEYLLSDESVDETILANGYEFTESGHIS